ncbi:nematocyst expressed protein 3-like [Anopheles nili]|uniref:nematocyst expressed protein 3-like n=1 Tax=Anopheles nili TaxID=185578 RepID=UPI00237A30EA|nr:nematocyst expressed protein 3-like [Anopheles nili]
MAASSTYSLFQFVLVAVVVLFGSTAVEAGLGAPLVAAPLAAPVVTAAAYTLPTQGVLRTAYNQVVGRSYAPSFVPLATSLAYTAPAPPVVAPVVRALPTVYAAAPQLVAGPVLKTVRTYAAPLAVESPVAALTYAAPAVAPVVRAASVPVPAFAPSVYAARLAPALPAVGVAPAQATPGVIEARAAPAPVPAPAPAQRAFVTAFGSPDGIQLVGGSNPAFEGPALAGVPSNVDIARAAPGGQPGQPAGRSAAPAPVAPTPETFGVPQQTPFNEYGLPVSAPVNP